MSTRLLTANLAAAILLLHPQLSAAQPLETRSSSDEKVIAWGTWQKLACSQEVRVIWWGEWDALICAEDGKVIWWAGWNDRASSGESWVTGCGEGTGQLGATEMWMFWAE